MLFGFIILFKLVQYYRKWQYEMAIKDLTEKSKNDEDARAKEVAQEQVEAGRRKQWLESEKLKKNEEENKR